MAQERTKGNGRHKIELDALDAQILAAQRDNPGLSYRELGKKVGVSHVTIHRRLIKIHNSDPVQDAIKRIAELTPLASQVYEDILQDDQHPDRLPAARDVLRGRGILKDHARHENSSVPRTADDFIRYFEDMSTEEQDRVIERIAERLAGVEESPLPDGGVVAGDESPQDASQRAA